MTVGSPLRDTFWDDAFSNAWQCLSALSSCIVLEVGDSDPGEGVTCSPSTKELSAISSTPGLIVSKPSVSIVFLQWRRTLQSWTPGVEGVWL